MHKGRRGPYSEHFEEALIRAFFADKKEGFFLDVGCAAPRKHSTTCFLETELDWRGIGIDACPMNLDGWAEYRPRTELYRYVVTDQDNQQVDFYEAGWVGSTQALRQIVDKVIEGSPMTIPSITLNTLLDRCSVEQIDFLSMDIEEGELKALSAFDLARFSPKLVCIEQCPNTRDGIMDYFMTRGYARIEYYLRFDSVNWYFVPV